VWGDSVEEHLDERRGKKNEWGGVSLEEKPSSYPSKIIGKNKQARKVRQ